MTDQPEPPASADSESKPPVKQQVEQQVERAREYMMRFELPQRLMLIGSAVVFLLGFLSWYVVAVPLMRTGVSGFSPWHGKLFFVTSLGTVLLLTVASIRQQVIGKQSEQNQKLIFLGLVGGTLIFGPVWFMLGADEVPDMSGAGVSIGKTFWFWLAFLAAGVAVVGGVMGMKPGAGEKS